MTTPIHPAPKPILVVVDLQSQSRQVIEHALLLGRQRSLPVVALHVVHEAGKSTGFYRHHDQGNPVLPMQEVARRLLEELVAEVASEQGDVTALPQLVTRVVVGVPAGRILEVAEQEDVDTIVMLNDDCRGMARLLYGSVAEKVMKRTDRNMMLLHQESERSKAVSPMRPPMASQPLPG